MILAVVVASYAAVADDNPGHSPEAERDAARARRADPPAAPDRMQRPLLRLFDADRDGQLDEAERAKAKRALRRFDKNGDGRLDETERAAVRRFLASGQAARGRDTGAPSPEAATRRRNPERAARQGRAPDPARLRAMVLRAYDEDGDGHLGPDEIRKLRADLAPIMRLGDRAGRARPSRAGEPRRAARSAED
jgi:hypothetical protein